MEYRFTSGGVQDWFNLTTPPVELLPTLDGKLVPATCSAVMTNTAWKLSKHGVISGPYFPVLGLNTGKYRPEITHTFHAVHCARTSCC